MTPVGICYDGVAALFTTTNDRDLSEAPSAMNQQNFTPSSSLFSKLLQVSEVMSLHTEHHRTNSDRIREELNPPLPISPDHFYEIFSRKRGRPSLKGITYETSRSASPKSDDSDNNSIVLGQEEESINERESYYSGNHNLSIKSRKLNTSQIARERRKKWEKSLLDFYASLYKRVVFKEKKVKLLQSEIAILSKRNLEFSSLPHS